LDAFIRLIFYGASWKQQQIYIIKAFPKIEFGIKTLYLQDIMQTTHKDRVVLVPSTFVLELFVYVYYIDE
jgi:hypothetical protein